ncbi:helix-turn-helix transcriptional regulator [bacterium]|nr:helix-turn-helix transcriptional regulator [bacterium]
MLNDHENLTRFAVNLRELMRINNYTVQSFAERTGVSVSAVMNYRMAKRSAPVVNLYIFQEVFDCTFDELLG